VRRRAALAAAVAMVGVGAAAIVAGQDDADGGPEARDASTKRWLPLTSSPLQRTEVGAARIGPFVDVVGGFASNQETTNQATRYDIRSDSWSLVASMPIGLNHPAVAAHGGKLYVHGGYTGSGDLSGEVNRLYRYDPGTDSWARLADSGTPRAAHALRGIGGKLYAAGGARAGGQALALLEIYDVATDRWSAAPSMRTAREHVGGAVSGGELFVIAGRAGGRNLRVVERFDAKERRWSRVKPVGVPRSGFGATTVKGRIVIAGGEQLAEGSETIPPVEVYDPQEKRWRRLPAMRTPRHGLGVVSLGRRVFAIEGGPQPGFSFSGLIEALDVSSP